MSRRATAVLWFGVHVERLDDAQYARLEGHEREGRVVLRGLPLAASDSGHVLAVPGLCFETEEMGVADIGLTLPALDVKRVAAFLDALNDVFGTDAAPFPVWRVGARYV